MKKHNKNSDLRFMNSQSRRFLTAWGVRHLVFQLPSNCVTQATGHEARAQEMKPDD